MGMANLTKNGWVWVGMSMGIDSFAKLVINKQVLCFLIKTANKITLLIQYNQHTLDAPLSSSTHSASTSHKHPSSSKCQARAEDVAKTPARSCGVRARPRSVSIAHHVPNNTGVASPSPDAKTEVRHHSHPLHHLTTQRSEERRC